MNRLLKLEEVGQLLLSIVLFRQLEYSWWFFLALLLTPDISMLAYLVNARLGAWTYNLFHNKLIAIAVFLGGFFMNIPWLTLSGIILFAHASMDRMLGYGLKFEDDFKHTHLGWIGRGTKE